jgi:hypothetical protein
MCLPRRLSGRSEQAEIPDADLYSHLLPRGSANGVTEIVRPVGSPTETVNVTIQGTRLAVLHFATPVRVCARVQCTGAQYMCTKQARKRDLHDDNAAVYI